MDSGRPESIFYRTKALTENIRHSSLGDFKALPIFPSLQEEGAEGGGYDVKIDRPGKPLMIQFKVPEVIVRSTSKLPGTFQRPNHNLPYYRMHLRPYRHSEQHRLLMEHEDSGNLVYYACPRFHTYQDLNNYYLSNELWVRSLIVHPSEIGDLPDDYNHHIAYERDNVGFVFQSDERFVEGSYDGNSALEKLQDLVPINISIEQTQNDFEELFNSMIVMVQERNLGKGEIPNIEQIRNRGPVAGAAYLSKIFFDCDLFLLGRVALEESD